MTGIPAVEYGVRDEHGDLWEWSCGHPRTFDSVEKLLAWCNIDAQDTIVRRVVTATPWEDFIPAIAERQTKVYPITDAELEAAEHALLAAEEGCASITSRVHAVFGAIDHLRAGLVAERETKK